MFYYVSHEELLVWNIFLGNEKIYKYSSMNRFVSGFRKNITIINIEQTIFLLKRALYFLMEVVSKRGEIFIILETKYIDKKLFLNEKFLKEPWIGGMLTNIKKIYILREYNIEYDFYPATVILLREDDKKYYIINESNRLKIPIITLTNTNMIPQMSSYIIPSNNSLITIINYYVEVFVKTILLGYIKEKILFIKKWKRRKKLRFNYFSIGRIVNVYGYLNLRKKFWFIKFKKIKKLNILLRNKNNLIKKFIIFDKKKFIIFRIKRKMNFKINKKSLFNKNKKYALLKRRKYFK